MELLSIGFPTRGGIARGPHFMDEDFAFGNALIEAVQFDESGMPPRVVLAPDVAAIATRHAYEGRFPYVVKDNDGLLVVSYLGALFENFPDFPLHFETLTTHRNAIIAGLSNAEPTVQDKYRWLACYHNFACRDRQAQPYGANDEDMAHAIWSDLQRLDEYLIADEYLDTANYTFSSQLR